MRRSTITENRIAAGLPREVRGPFKTEIPNRVGFWLLAFSTARRFTRDRRRFIRSFNKRSGKEKNSIDRIYK